MNSAGELVLGKEALVQFNLAGGEQFKAPDDFWMEAGETLMLKNIKHPDRQGYIFLGLGRSGWRDSGGVHRSRRRCIS